MIEVAREDWIRNYYIRSSTEVVQIVDEMRVNKLRCIKDTEAVRVVTGIYVNGIRVNRKTKKVVRHVLVIKSDMRWAIVSEEGAGDRVLWKFF